MSKEYLINLKRIFDGGEASLTVERKVNLNNQQVSKKQIFKKPVEVKGLVKNTSGLVGIMYTVDAKIDTTCDRCLGEVFKDFHKSFNHNLVEQVNLEQSLDEYTLCQNGYLDLEELVLTDVFLNLDAKFLCKEDCKGLCEVCGQNHNEASCNCNKKEIDPRLAVLKKLL